MSEKKPILVRVSYYRVSPKSCPASRSLAAISACSRERNASGVGVRVSLRALFGDEVGAKNAWSCTHGVGAVGYCYACSRLLAETALVRHDVVHDVAEKFSVTEHGNNSCVPAHRSVYLQVHRGELEKVHLQLTKKVMKSVSARFRKRGYTVHVMTDEGGWSE